MVRTCIMIVKKCWSCKCALLATVPGNIDVNSFPFYFELLINFQKSSGAIVSAYNFSYPLHLCYLCIPEGIPKDSKLAVLKKIFAV